MKLAEALQERADLNRKIDQLESRINNNVLVQEGDRPNEDPNAMLAELKESVSRLEVLMQKINLSNCINKVEGISLTDMIAKKDTLKLLFNSYRNAISSASRKTDRARGSEIRILPAIDVAALRKEADAVAKELRLIDNKLQQANWTFDLIED